MVSDLPLHISLLESRFDLGFGNLSLSAHKNHF